MCKGLVHAWRCALHACSSLRLLLARKSAPEVCPLHFHPAPAPKFSPPNPPVPGPAPCSSQAWTRWGWSAPPRWACCSSTPSLPRWWAGARMRPRAPRCRRRRAQRGLCWPAWASGWGGPSTAGGSWMTMMTGGRWPSQLRRRQMQRRLLARSSRQAQSSDAWARL